MDTLLFGILRIITSDIAINTLLLISVLLPLYSIYTKKPKAILLQGALASSIAVYIFTVRLNPWALLPLILSIYPMLKYALTTQAGEKKINLLKLIPLVVLLIAIISISIIAYKIPGSSLKRYINNADYPKQAFGVYLLKNDIPAHDWKKIDINTVELSEYPIIPLDAILYFDKGNIVVDSRLPISKAIRKDVYGQLCVIVVNGKAKYIAAFWSQVSSVSFDGIVLLINPWQNETATKNDVFKVQLGYPAQSYYKGKENIDPSKDPEIIKVFKENGKIRE